MKNNSKNVLLVLSGIAAGAAASYFLQTKAGKELRTDISAKSNEIAGSLSDKLDQVKGSLIDTAIQTLNSSENGITKFNEGVKSAKQNLINVSDN